MESLILLGASVRAAAFSALRAGYAPYAIDLFADRDLAAICPAVKISRYPNDFLPALAAAPQAPWLYTGGLENYPTLIDRLVAVRPLLGNPGAVVRRIRAVAGFGRAVQRSGCTFPTTWNDGVSVGRSPANISPDWRWLVKPRRSCGGIGVRFASGNESRRQPRGTYLQAHVPGQSASAIFVAARNQAVLLGATRQLLGSDFDMSRPFLYVGSVGPLSLSESELSQLHSLGNVLANQFHLVGLFNVDFVKREDGLWPVEVNPRYSASMEIIERITGTKLIDLHVQACQSGADIPVCSTPNPGTAPFVGKAIVYTPRNCLAPKALEDLEREWNTDPRWPTLADLPRTGDTLHAHQPVVTVFAEANTLTAVETQLRHRIATIQRLLTDS